MSAAVAPEAAEDVPGQTLGVGPKQDRLLRIDIPEHEGQVVLVPE